MSTHSSTISPLGNVQASIYAVLSVILIVFCATTRSFSQVYQWRSAGLPVNQSAGLQRVPKIASDGNGGAIVAWENLKTSPGDLYAQRIDRKGQALWDTAGVVICAAPDIQRIAEIIPDGSGGAIISWSDKRNGNDFDIYLQRIDAFGNTKWKADGALACDAPQDQVQAQIIPDEEGGAFLLWQDKRSGTFDLYAQHISKDGQALWQRNGILVCAASGEKMSAAITTDSQKGLIAAWQDKRSGENIYAQRITSGGALLWASDGVPVCIANRTQHSPCIATDNAGGAFVCWFDFRSSDTAEVYLQRVDGNGKALLATNGILLASVGAIAKNNLQLTADGVGGAISAWTGFTTGSSAGNIYARRIDKNGTVRWGGASGLTITNATDSQELPQLISDDAGGALIVWQDRQNTRDYDLFMQRVDALGNVKWTSNGVPLLRFDKDQISIALTISTPGNAIITWQDGRIANGVADIYAQSVGFAPIVFLADSIAFNSTRVGKDDRQNISVRNVGADTLTITGLSGATGEFFPVGQPGLPARITPGDSIILSINFRPTSSGRRTATLTVTSNASSSPKAILLAGRGELPDLGATPATINMGRIKVGKSKDTTIAALLKNTGTGKLTILSLEIGGRNGNEFSFVNAPATPFTIPEGQAVSLTVRHTAMFATVTSASLIIISDGSTSNRIVALTDTAVHPIPTFLPTGFIAFPLTDAGKQTMRYVIVRDSSVSPVSLEVLSISLEGKDRNDFRLTSNLTLPAILQPRDSLTITVAFSPLGSGLRTAQLRIDIDHPASPKNISLYGLSSIPVSTEALPIASQISLGQNYPNPTSSLTTIPFEITSDVASRNFNHGIRLVVYDLLGREVATIARHQLEVGKNQISFDASRLQAGVYCYRLMVGDQAMTRKMVVVR